MQHEPQPYALPVNLLMAGRLCLVIGGGRVALRKCRSLLEAGARVRLVSPAAVPELERLAAENRIEWVRRNFEPADIQGALRPAPIIGF
ncbi:MAG: NAD(P)-dependent oxidoreductase [Lentisphaerae bacterium]|nr:NAD(P)-dependent oxidoreductase [Lentisphaerota bacterium]